jgi:hypothetical protein
VSTGRHFWRFRDDCGVLGFGIICVNALTVYAAIVSLVQAQNTYDRFSYHRGFPNTNFPHPRHLGRLGGPPASLSLSFLPVNRFRAFCRLILPTSLSTICSHIAEEVPTFCCLEVSWGNRRAILKGFRGSCVRCLLHHTLLSNPYPFRVQIWTHVLRLTVFEFWGL